MKKTYKSKLHQYSTYVKKNGVLVPVDFEKLLQPNHLFGSTYETDEVEMQEALESHRDYGIKFWTDDKEEIVEVKEEVQEEPKRVKRYKNKD